MMKYKFGAILNTEKKKVAAAVVCGALALTLGTGAVFAANSTNTREKLLAKVENGVSSYSTDDGQTWSKNAPEGIMEKTNEDGTMTSSVGDIPPKDGSDKSLMVQNKNGEIRYSTDGGNTWSEKAPEGVQSSVNKDESVSVKSGN